MGPGLCFTERKSQYSVVDARTGMQYGNKQISEGGRYSWILDTRGNEPARNPNVDIRSKKWEMTHPQIVLEVRPWMLYSECQQNTLTLSPPLADPKRSIDTR